MKKFEIINDSLVITDMVVNKVVFDEPKSNVYYSLYSLQSPTKLIQLTDVSANDDRAIAFTCSLSNASDSTLVPFTEASFQDFVRTNRLGFKTASGGSGAEADPLFNGSEAKLFVSGDKAKLDNALTITNIGSVVLNETISQGTILNEEYPIAGLIASKPVIINWNGFIFPLTAFVSYRALRDGFVNITIENKGDAPLFINQTIIINN